MDDGIEMLKNLHKDLPTMLLVKLKMLKKFGESQFLALVKQDFVEYFRD
jgi:hypothetical protein